MHYMGFIGFVYYELEGVRKKIEDDPEALGIIMFALVVSSILVAATIFALSPGMVDYENGNRDALKEIKDADCQYSNQDPS